MKFTHKHYLTAVSFFLFFACSSTPDFNSKRESFPSSNIDRPYALPEGLNTWKVLFASQPDQVAGDWQNHLLFYPLIWEHSLSDTVDMIWSPFPLDIRVQLFDNANWTGGFSINAISPITKRSKDFTWRPTFSPFARLKISPQMALVWEGTFQAEVRTRSKGKNSYVIGKEFGFLWQVHSDFSAVPKLALIGEKGDPSGRYLGRSPNQDKSLWYLRVPIGLDLQWNLTKRWELMLQYQHSGWGYSNAYEFHLGRLWLTHYWD